MRAIIRIVLTDTTRMKAVEVVETIEKALEDEVVQKDIEVSIMSK